ncbi:MAG: IS4 family transposase [Gemmatimonadaceae bacterium]
MHTGRTVFAQLMDFLPLREFRACVGRYDGDYKVRSFSCLDQFLTLAFAQLTHRDSLRDIETSLRAMEPRLYHMGFRGTIARSTLAEANETRDWRIHADFAHGLIATARKLYATEDLGLELAQTVYALDATTIDLCLSLFPWATFRRHKGAIKLHTLLDLRGSIPSVVEITPGSVHEINILDRLIAEPGAIYVMDRGYLDFTRLYTLAQAGAFFVLRSRERLRHVRVYSHPADRAMRATGLRSDQTIRLTGPRTQHAYPGHLRRVRFHDAGQARTFTFLTNHTGLPALTIAELYKLRWQVELFFKWIKQHLRIKAFYGTSENAVKTQVWTAITVYVLVAIVKKRLAIKLPLYTILQILSVTLFEKVSLPQLLTNFDPGNDITAIPNQLPLFEL